MILKTILISSLFFFLGCSSHPTPCKGVIVNEKCASENLISGTVIFKHNQHNLYKYVILDNSGKSITYETANNYRINQRVDIRYEIK